MGYVDQGVNVLLHMNPRYLDLKLCEKQNDSTIAWKRGIVAEGYEINKRCEYLKQAIAAIQEDVTSMNSTINGFLVSFTCLVHTFETTASTIGFSIPPTLRMISNGYKSYEDTLIPRILNDIQKLEINANAAFSNSLKSMDSLLEERQALVVENAKLSSQGQNSDEKLPDDRRGELLNRISIIENQLSVLIDEVQESSQEYVTQASNHLHTLWEGITKDIGVCMSQDRMNDKPLIDTPVGGIGDLDSLMSNAFSLRGLRQDDLSSRTYTPYSPLPSQLDHSSSPSLSLNDVSSPFHQSSSSFSNIPTAQTERPSTSSLYADVADVADTPLALVERKGNPSPLYKRMFVEVYAASLSSKSEHCQAMEKVLNTAGYDIVRIALATHYLLGITSRGNIISYVFHPKQCPIASGLQDFSTTQLETPCLIPTLLLERAIRNKRYVSASCGEDFSVILSSAGEVYSWGKGSHGELGLGDITELKQPEICVKLLNVHIVSIACGSHHSLALDNHGTVYSWGGNENGQLGLGDRQARNEPVLVTALKKSRIVAIRAGGAHSVVLDDQGHVYCFGKNDRGQCGNTPTTDCLLPILLHHISGEVVDISCGSDHAMALTSTGDVFCWGCGMHGEMGIHTAIAYATAPQLVPLARILQEREIIRMVYCGAHRCVVVSNLSRVFSWGDHDSVIPMALSLPTKERITSIVIQNELSIILSNREHTEEDVDTIDTSENNLDRHSFYAKSSAVSTSKVRALSKDWALAQRKCIREWNDLLSIPGLSFRGNSSIISLIDLGIPPSIRQRVWPLLIGNPLKTTPEAFELFKSRAEESAHIVGESIFDTMIMGKEATARLIDEDLKRTFVPLGFFSIGEPLYQKMREILLTYAYYRPDIGYVQGMSFLAGILSAHITDTYLCFQCLANLLGSGHLYAFYSLKPSFMQQYYEIFNSIFSAINPALFEYFTSNDIATSMFLFKWLQSLYAQCFSIEITARIWDCFLLDGTSFLFRTALAILRLLQHPIMTISIDECLTLLTGSARASKVWNECITMDSLFATIQRIRFTEKQNQAISDLVENAFFYQEKDVNFIQNKTRTKSKRIVTSLTNDEVRHALSSVL